MKTFYIYHIPNFVHKSGKIGKIGVSTEPEDRVKNQGYSDYQILEKHKCIDKVSIREQELQKQYGYPVDKMMYSISYTNRINNVKFLTTEVRRKGGLTNAKSGHLKKIARSGGLANVKSGKAYISQKIATKVATEVNKKPVGKYDKDGNLLQKYNSIKEAAIKNNKQPCTLSNNIAGVTKYCGGYKYKLL